MREIWVISSRPYAEKVLGGMVVDTGPHKTTACQCDGTFWLDHIGALEAFNELDEEMKPYFKVRKGYIELEKDKEED